MKLYIERNGSGWGGLYGQYLVDLDTNKFVVLDEPKQCGSCNYNKFEKIKWLQSLDNSDCSHDISGDCSLLKMLKGIELESTSVSMDAQDDQAFIIDGNFVQLVYSPDSVPFVTPSNQTLVAKIHAVMDFLSYEIRKLPISKKC